MMSDDEPETTDVVVDGPAVVEIDAERISAIILEVCHSSATNAARAASKILDYLAEVHQKATRLT
jgi:hypothetical protein